MTRAVRLLMIARHFPPTVSGGARRPAGLARALASLGAEVFVAAPSLPDDFKGVMVPHPHETPTASGPPSALTLRDRLRLLLFVPDPDIRWARRAAGIAAQACPFRPDWVFTTAPPESTHAAGAALARRFDARWVADFRDSWLEEPLRPELRSPVRRARERAWAVRTLRRADLVTTTQESINGELSRLLPLGRVRTLEQFADAAPISRRLDGEGPHFVHTGSFTLSDPRRTIEPLLTIFAQVAARRPSARLNLAGHLTDAERAALASSPAGAQIVDHGVLDADASRALQAAADALIVAAAPGTQAVPGKIWEYRASGRPVVAIGAGPWIEAAGLAALDPVAALLDIGGLAPPQPPPDARAVARALLDMMDDAARGA